MTTTDNPSGGPAWPFLIRRVTDAKELDAVVQLRHQAYSRKDVYQPGFTAALQQVDRLDLSLASTVLGAIDKDTGRVLGTVRLTLNRDVPDVLPAVVPASPLTRGVFTFIDRFAVRPGADRLVGPALMKALWLWSKQEKSQALVALAQRLLVAHYSRWGGLEPQGDGEPIQVPDDLREPVYFVGQSMSRIFAQAAKNNPAFAAFLELDHADIDVRSRREVAYA